MSAADTVLRETQPQHPHRHISGMHPSDTEYPGKELLPASEGRPTPGQAPGLSRLRIPRANMLLGIGSTKPTILQEGSSGSNTLERGHGKQEMNSHVRMIKTSSTKKFCPKR